MKLRHRLAAIVAMALLTTAPATIALGAASTPDQVATGGTIVVEN